MLREERNSRAQLEDALRANNDVIQQLTNRLSQEERSAISSLVHHTKSVEQPVLDSQQELLPHRDVQNQKYVNNVAVRPPVKVEDKILRAQKVFVVKIKTCLLCFIELCLFMLLHNKVSGKIQ